MGAMKMGQSAISVCLGDIIKKQFDNSCAENDPFYGESNTKILRESIEQMEKHPEKNVVKTLEELDALGEADV